MTAKSCIPFGLSVTTLFLVLLCPSETPPHVAVVPSNQDPAVRDETDGRHVAPPPNFGQTERERIERLIEQLGAVTFADRQIASEQLWNSGPVVMESLRAALNHPDPEVVRRVRNILDVMELGVDSTTPRSTALMILYFKEGERKVREQIIRSLAQQLDYQLIFELLGDLKDADERQQIYSEEIELERAIYRLAIQEKWETIGTILDHEIAWEFDQPLCIYYALLHGRFDAKLASLNSWVANYEAELAVASSNRRRQDGTAKQRGVQNKKFARAVLLIVKMLRVANRHEEAITYAEKIDDVALRLGFINGMEMETGRWASVANRLDQDSEQVVANDAMVPARLPQIALAYYFAGDRVAYEKILAKIVEQVSNTSQQEDSGPASELVNLMLVTLDWDAAQKHLNPSQPEANFQLYAFLQRNEKALQSVGLSDDFDQRFIWFRRLTKQLESIFNQYGRIANVNGVRRRINQQIGLPTIDEDSVDARSAEVFELGISAASHLGSLGFTEESKLYLRSIADSITRDNPRSYDKRTEILRLLIELGAHDEAWKLLAERFHENEFADVFRVMFPYKYSSFEFWNGHLAPARPDVLRRAQFVAGIINSPLGTTEKTESEIASGPGVRKQEGISDLDLASAISLVDSKLFSAKPSVRGKANYQIAMTLFYNGDFESSRRYLEIAARDHNYYAETRLADLALELGDYKLALEFHERLWRKSVSATTSTYSARAAAECFQRLGLPEQARQRKLVAFVAWLKSYRTDLVLNQFTQNKKDHWLVDTLNISTHVADGSLLTNEHYRQALAVSQEQAAPHRAANNWRIYLFNRFASKEPGNHIAMANVACKLQFDAALAQLDQGKSDRAFELLERLDLFRPGDSEIGERLIPEFDKLGESKKADELFEMVAKYYASTLGRYPDSPLHNNNYAWLCASSQRRLEYAQFHADLAVESRPDNSSYLDTSAQLRFLNGDPDAAIELSRRCLQIRPSKRHYQEQFLRFGGKL